MSGNGNLTTLFFEAVDRYAETRPAAYRAKVGGTWRSITHREAASRVKAISIGLRELGLKSGDRVAILSETRPEWALADWASLRRHVRKSLGKFVWSRTGRRPIILPVVMEV